MYYIILELEYIIFFILEWSRFIKLCLLLHIAQQLSDLFVESLSDTAERETRIQLAALNNYPGRRKKNRRPHQFEFSLRPLVAASRITYAIA